MEGSNLHAGDAVSCDLKTKNIFVTSFFMNGSARF